MYTILAIFFGSLTGIVTLLIYRMWEVDTGRISIRSSDAFSAESIAPLVGEIKESLLFELNKQGRLAVLKALRYSIKVTYALKKKTDVVVSRIHRKALYHHHKISESTNDEDTAGSFLEVIGEYKAKIKKISKKNKI